MIHANIMPSPRGSQPQQQQHCAPAQHVVRSFGWICDAPTVSEQRQVEDYYSNTL